MRDKDVRQAVVLTGQYRERSSAIDTDTLAGTKRFKDASEGGTSRRGVLAGGMAAASGLLLAACGPLTRPAAQPTASPPSAAGRPRGGPLYVLDHSLQQAVRDVLLKRIADFEREFPGAKIEYDDVPGDNSQKFPVLIAAGTFPDVSVTHTAFVDQYPHFMDLAPFLAKERVVKAADYFPTFYSAFRVPVGGVPRQIALPREVHVTILYYNRNAVRAAGLNEPARDWTHTDFVDFGLKLRRWTNDPSTSTWAIINGTGLGGASSGLATYWSHGAEFFSDDGRQVLIDRPEAREALQYMVDLVVRHHIGPSPAEATAANFGDTIKAFAAGRFPMYSCNQNCSPTTSALQTGFEWDIQAVPQVPGRRRATRLAGNAYGLLTQGNNKNPELGWELIKYFVGEQGSKLVVQGATLYMSHKKAAEEWAATLNRTAGVKNGKVVADVLEQWARKEQTLLKGWGKAMAPIHREWTALQNGERSIGEAINIAKPEAEAVLAAEAAR